MPKRADGDPLSNRVVNPIRFELFPGEILRWLGSVRSSLETFSGVVYFDSLVSYSYITSVKIYFYSYFFLFGTGDCYKTR